MVVTLGARGVSASAEQLTAKPQEEITVAELLRIAAEFTEHGFASDGLGYWAISAANTAYETHFAVRVALISEYVISLFFFN